MKILYKIITQLSLILILAGSGLIIFKYMTNKSLFSALISTPVVHQSMGVIKIMLLGVAIVLLGLILLTLAMKMGSSIKAKERAEAKVRKAIEKEQEKAAKEAEEVNARYEKQNAEAEDEANRILNI